MGEGEGWKGGVTASALIDYAYGIELKCLQNAMNRRWYVSTAYTWGCQLVHL